MAGSPFPSYNRVASSDRTVEEGKPFFGVDHVAMNFSREPPHKLLLGIFLPCRHFLAGTAGNRWEPLGTSASPSPPESAGSTAPARGPPRSRPLGPGPGESRGAANFRRPENPERRGGLRPILTPSMDDLQFALEKKEKRKKHCLLVLTRKRAIAGFLRSSSTV